MQKPPRAWKRLAIHFNTTDPVVNAFVARLQRERRLSTVISELLTAMAYVYADQGTPRGDE